jgi:PKD repeat protein
MAENEEDQAGKKKGGGWIKAVLGTVGGLLSGAAAMYFGAFIDKAVKPAKPVPNFRVEADGRTVRFQDLSPGFTGWWDFGDGTELVPADTSHQSVSHTYQRTGDYSVKLSLANLLGEQADRTVSVHVEEAADAKQPRVVKLEAVRVSPGNGAPAVFRVTAQTENAPLCIWHDGDDRPCEAVADETGSQVRLVKFDRAGSYPIQLTAVNDDKIDEAKTVVVVKDKPAGAIGVVLSWTDAGTRVHKRTVPCTFCDTFRADVQDAECPLSGRDHCAACSTDACKDWVIRDVQVTGPNGKPVSLGDSLDAPLDPAALGLANVQNLKLQLPADRSSVHLLGKLVRPADKNAPAPSVVLEGVLMEEARKPVSRPVQVPVTLAPPAPGQTTTEYVPMPPPPADWVDVQPPKVVLTLAGWPAMMAPQTPAPGRTDIVLQKRRYTLVTKIVKDQIRLDLMAAGGTN